MLRAKFNEYFNVQVIFPNFQFLRGENFPVVKYKTTPNSFFFFQNLFRMFPSNSVHIFSLLLSLEFGYALVISIL